MMKHYNMLKKLGGATIVAAMMVGACETASADVVINETTFPDENFRNYVKTLAGGADGTFTDAEIAGIKVISCYDKNIASMEGLEYFTALTVLSCSGNQLTSLDVSGMTTLETLSCGGGDGQLASLNVSGCTGLKKIDIAESLLANLNVSGCMALEELELMETEITSLDVSGMTRLKKLNCIYNHHLTSLNVSGCTALEELWCDDQGFELGPGSSNIGNGLESLNVSGCTALQLLRCQRNKLTSLDVSDCTALEQLEMFANRLTTIDLTNNTALTWVSSNLQYHDVAVNYSFEQDGQTYYYLDMENDEREGMSGDELHNKISMAFDIDKVEYWQYAETEEDVSGTESSDKVKVGQTPLGGTNALIWTGQPWAIGYMYKTCDGQMPMQVILTLSYEGVTTAVEDIEVAASVRIYATESGICIEGSEEEARVYDIAGRCVYSGMERAIWVPAGLYIVKVGNTETEVAKITTFHK